MERMMKTAAVVTTAAAICFAVITAVTVGAVFLSLAITFSVIAYHFLMRLIVGTLFNAFMHNKANVHRRWYQVKPWEQKLYEKLGVKRWKKQLPTYDASLFDPRLHSWDEIAQAMCQAELVHETIAVLSFLPILLGFVFGDWAVFIITSVISAAVDLLFVIMQRYNRPRVVRLAEKKQKAQNE